MGSLEFERPAYSFLKPVRVVSPSREPLSLLPKLNRRAALTARFSFWVPVLQGRLTRGFIIPEGGVVHCGGAAIPLSNPGFANPGRVGKESHFFVLQTLQYRRLIVVAQPMSAFSRTGVRPSPLRYGANSRGKPLACA